MMAMVMMFAVLISGCANQEEEYKKAKGEFLKLWNPVTAEYNKNTNNINNSIVAPKGVFEKWQATRFYKLKEAVPNVEKSLAELEQKAKGNQQLEKDARSYRDRLTKMKDEALYAAKNSKIVSGKDLNYDGSQKDTTNKDGKKYGMVTGTEVRMRKGPGTDTEIIGEFQKGTRLEILEKKGNWYKVVNTNTFIGWISGDFFKPE